MIKKDLIEEVIHKTGLNKTMVKEVVDSFLEVLTKALSENRRVELRKFGVFEIRRINAKKARNPRTGQEVIVPKKDKIEISKQAIAMQNTEETKNLAEIQKKIDSGFYNSDEVVSKVADSILKEIGK